MPHRINSASAGTAALRFSLVWKLVMLPKAEAASLSRPEWGQPLRFGSAGGPPIGAAITTGTGAPTADLFGQRPSDGRVS